MMINSEIKIAIDHVLRLQRVFSMIDNNIHKLIN